MYVSIIIPVYNRELLLKRALQSVFQQSFKKFEVIVVDDGSTDNLEGVLKNFSDPRLKIIKHSNNRGAAAARNTAIKAAQGDLIAFLDSDDEWCPTKLEEQISHFDHIKKTNPRIMGSFTWFFLYRESGFVELRKFKKITNWKYYFLGGCLISPGSTFLVDKKSYESVGFYDESLKQLEDWEWLLRFSKKFDLVVCQKPLSHIYQGKRPLPHNVQSALQKIIQVNIQEFSGFEKIKFLKGSTITK